MNLFSILTIAIIILIALFVLGLILTRLYRRASKEVSFVRTGFGGEKSHRQWWCDCPACVARSDSCEYEYSSP